MKRKVLIITSALIVIVMLGGYFILNGNSGVEAEMAEVKKGIIQSFVEETGIVKSNNQRIIHAKNMGEVLSLNYSAGDKINEGDVLINMNTEETDLQIKSLEAKIDAIKASYDEAVKLPDKELINKAEANVKTYEIMVEEAQKNLDNTKKLYDEGAISNDVYQKALNNLNIQKQALEIANNELSALKKGASENIKKQYEAQMADLQYQLDILKSNKGDLLVKSPISGTILETYVQEGSYLQIGTPIVEIGDINDLYIELEVLASEIGDIREGAEVLLSNEDLNIDEIKGTVKKVYPKAYSKISDLGIEQKRVKVEVELSDYNDRLKVGYELNSRVITRDLKNVLIIPDNSVFEYEDGKYVFLVENNTAKLQKVEIGVEGEDIVEITAGLAEGDIVIRNPDENIEEGTVIKTK